MVESLRTQLDQGLVALELDPAEAVRERLLAYVALLVKWNRAYNLTAVREPREMITRHLLDSLAVVPHLTGEFIADVGSGAGLPGIPLALMFPELDFTLLDSNGKKTRFITQAAAELGLGNVTVVHSRVERFHPEPLFDTVITRAFSALANMLDGAGALIAPGGCFLAMKGAYPEEELAAVPEGYRVDAVIPLAVPGLDAARHLVRIVPDPAA